MKKMFLLLGMISLSFLGFAQISKKGATKIVMDSVVGNDVTNVNVYMEPLAQMNPYYVMSPYDSIQSPYTNYWLFFIDDMPEYMWYHACRYVFVNSNNGQFQSVPKQKPPTRLFRCFERVSMSTEEIIGPQYIINCHAATPVADINNGKFAVLFCSDFHDYEVFWNSISHMYCALKEQGYPKENIYVLANDGTTNTNPKMDFDGDGLPDILPHPCDSVNLCAVFDTLTQRMVDGDILHVHALVHGGRNENQEMEIALWGEEGNGKVFKSTSFANLFNGLNCSIITMNIHACFAGCLVGDLLNAFPLNTKYSILTCIGAQEYHRDLSFASKTGMDVYHFLSCSAFRGSYPDSCYLWNTTYQIGANPYFGEVFPHKIERNFDVTWGNNNGLHEIKEIIQFCKFDYQFDSIGPLNSYSCGFVEDLLSLRGITGNVTHSQTVNGSFHIEDNLSITNNETLELDTNSKFFLFDANLCVDAGASLSLLDNTSIVARSGNCRVYICGDIEFGHNVSFRAENGSTLEIVFANTTTQQIADTVSFQNCIVSSYSNCDMKLDYCIFNNCQITPTGNFTISNCTLTESSILAETPSFYTYKLGTISNCTISNLNKVGISMINYMYYHINGNTIIANNHLGIFLSTCGRNVNVNPQVSDNIVTGCSVGIQAYSSRGIIQDNYVYGNVIGLHLDNISNMNIVGSQSGNGQRIVDNNGIEVFVSGNSFPGSFKYNRIVDEDNGGNPNDPLLKYSMGIDSEGTPLVFDIENNYWGNCFVASEDLNPSAIFDYDPVWDGRGTLSPESQLYQNAENAISLDQFDTADSLYRLIISDHPNSSYAQASMKQMLFMESLLQNGYNGLKDYYLHISDTALLVMADNLANKCDEMMKNWSSAISWYENVIQNPSSYEDSVYAVIDLGNLYLEMDSTKSTIGKMPEYRPISKKEHNDNTMMLLSTLPKLNKQFCFDLVPISNLSADYHNDTILLTWDFPETYQPETENLSWSGEMYNQTGSWLRPGSYSDIAHRYGTFDLRNYIGWKVKSIGIIPLDNHVVYYAAVWVKEGEEYVNIYQEPLVDTVLFEENIHELHEDIFIEASKEYLFGCRDLCDPALQGWSGYYDAVDEGPSVNGKGNMKNSFNEGWQAWPPMWNWCINTIIESPDGEVMALNQKKDEEPLTGYKVYKDGQLLENIGKRFQTYAIDNGYSVGETVTYSVTAIYGDKESEPVSVTFSYEGIKERNEMDNVIVSPNPTNDFVRIEGVSIAEVQVYDALGQMVKTVRNVNEVDMSSLSEGVYLLRIKATDGSLHIEKVSVSK